MKPAWYPVGKRKSRPLCAISPSAKRQRRLCTNQRRFTGRQLRSPVPYLIMNLTMMRAGRSNMNSSGRAFDRSLVRDRRSSARQYGIPLLKKLFSLMIWQDIPWKREFNGYAQAKTPSGNASIAFETEMEISTGSSRRQWNYAMRVGFHMAPLAHTRISPNASWPKRHYVKPKQNIVPW